MGGTWVHRLTDIDPEARTADCLNCGPRTPVKVRSNDGGWRCSLADKKWSTPESRKRWRQNDRRRDRTPEYRKHLKEQCESCGFVPVHKCQMDIDHIDMDHSNNSPENLQTLCANCHRLKTYRERRLEA